MISINELKEMNEKERMEWIVNAKSSYLNAILKNEGVKCIAKMKKAEKVAMIVRLVVENIADEDTKRIMEEAKKLKEEIEIRQCYEEKIEGTLYAMYKNKEITYDELRKTCNAYNIDIPLSSNEKNSIKIVDENCDLFSWYEHHDEDGNVYYSILDRKYEWKNLSLTSYDCRNDDWDLKQFYARNTVDDNGYLQLAYAFNDDGHYVLCVYKHYELLATYEEGCMEDIEDLAIYDCRLDDDDLLTYEELFESLGKQYGEHCEIMYTDEMLKKKLNCTEKSRELIIEELNRSNA